MARGEGGAYGDGGGIGWAIIGGTGVYDPDLLTGVEERIVPTPYGKALVTVGAYAGRAAAFLTRHGPGHGVPPHLINYRANIWALKHLGVRRIMATNAVGSLAPDIAPGELVLCDQFLDFTHGRESTFFTGGDQGVVHVDVTEPYCPELRALFHTAATDLGLPVHGQGTYVCTQGPRFETPAEIQMYATLGAHVVGMTSVPEVVLAREAGICYGSVGIVTNYAAGMVGEPLSHAEVLAIMAHNERRLRSLTEAMLFHTSDTPACHCRNVPAPMPGNISAPAAQPEPRGAGSNGL